MLMALAVLAVIEAAPAPAPVVEITRTGTGGEPVSAAPRSLSDVARELREGRKAVGGFSAIETTVTRGSVSYIPPVESEEEAPRAEPEVVSEPGPGYVEPYYPGWYGGPYRHWGFRRHHVAHHTVLGPKPRPAYRPGAPAPRQGTFAPGGHPHWRM